MVEDTNDTKVTVAWLHETLNMYGKWKKDARDDIYLNNQFLGYEGFFLKCLRGAVLTRIEQIMTTTEAERPRLDGGYFTVQSGNAVEVLSTIIHDASENL